MRKSAAHFKVTDCHVGGCQSHGTLTIEAPKASGVVLVTYKPSHGREFTLTLQEVAQMIAWRVSKKEAK